ncbi:7745_t:CDS:2, partial [Cetraspora pellucida]
TNLDNTKSEINNLNNSILLDSDDATTDSETSNNSLNNQHIQSASLIELIEDEYQEQETETINFVNNFDISVETVNYLQHPAIDPQAK